MLCSFQEAHVHFCLSPFDLLLCLFDILLSKCVSTKALLVFINECTQNAEHNCQCTCTCLFQYILQRTCLCTHTTFLQGENVLVFIPKDFTPNFIGWERGGAMLGSPFLHPTPNIRHTAVIIIIVSDHWVNHISFSVICYAVWLPPEWCNIINFNIHTVSLTVPPNHSLPTRCTADVTVYSSYSSSCRALFSLRAPMGSALYFMVAPRWGCVWTRIVTITHCGLPQNFNLKDSPRLLVDT